jgi:hypothetical protein
MPGHARKRSWWSEKSDLGTLLVRFRWSEATDPRDEVYALLGISSDANDMNVFRPDYERTAQQVVQSTISFLIFGSVLDPEMYKFPDWPLSEVIDGVASGNLIYEIMTWVVHDRRRGSSKIATAVRILSLKTLELGQNRFFKNLVDRGANHQLVQGFVRSFDYALLEAVKDGHGELVRLLLDNGEDVNRPDKNGHTALAWAAMQGRSSGGLLREVTEILLERGAQVDSRDNNGRTPLSWLIMGTSTPHRDQHRSTVELLLRPDPLLQDNEGRTPLDWVQDNGGPKLRTVDDLKVWYGLDQDDQWTDLMIDDTECGSGKCNT